MRVVGKALTEKKILMKERNKDGIIVVCCSCGNWADCSNRERRSFLLNAVIICRQRLGNLHRYGIIVKMFLLDKPQDRTVSVKIWRKKRIRDGNKMGIVAEIRKANGFKNFFLPKAWKTLRRFQERLLK